MFDWHITKRYCKLCYYVSKLSSGIKKWFDDIINMNYVKLCVVNYVDVPLLFKDRQTQKKMIFSLLNVPMISICNLLMTEQSVYHWVSVSSEKRINSYILRLYNVSSKNIWTREETKISLLDFEASFSHLLSLAFRIDLTHEDYLSLEASLYHLDALLLVLYLDLLPITFSSEYCRPVLIIYSILYHKIQK